MGWFGPSRGWRLALGRRAKKSYVWQWFEILQRATVHNQIPSTPVALNWRREGATGKKYSLERLVGETCAWDHFSVISDSATPWTVARQAPLSMGILQARILEWVACPSPGDLPDPGMEPGSPTSWWDFLPAEPPGQPCWCGDSIDNERWRKTGRVFARDSRLGPSKRLKRILRQSLIALGRKVASPGTHVLTVKVRLNIYPLWGSEGEPFGRQREGAGRQGNTEESRDQTAPSSSPPLKIGHGFTFCVFIF